MFTQEIIKIREEEGRGRMTFRRIFAIRSPLSEHIHHSHEFLPFLSRGESSLSLSVSRKPEENGKFFAIRSSSENETRYPPLMEERTVVTEELDRSLSRYFPLESNNDGPGLKASKASHTSVKPFLRFFSFGFNFPALYVHARTHKTRAKHSRSPLDSWGHKRGLFFSSRSIVRPTRFLLSFLFSFSSSSLLPFLPSLFFFFIFSLSPLSYLPPAHNSNALCRRNNGTKVLPGSRVGQDLSSNSCREFCCNFYSIRRRKFVGTPPFSRN